MILTVAAIAVAYLYLATLAWRVGHSGKHGKRVWSTPRPTRLFRQGSHAKQPPKPAPRSEAEDEAFKTAPTELAVAA